MNPTIKVLLVMAVLLCLVSFKCVLNDMGDAVARIDTQVGTLERTVEAVEYGVQESDMDAGCKGYFLQSWEGAVAAWKRVSVKVFKGHAAGHCMATQAEEAVLSIMSKCSTGNVLNDAIGDTVDELLDKYCVEEALDYEGKKTL